MQTIYRPGQWHLIVIPGALVALPPDAPADLVARLWDRLPAEKTLASVVDVLTTSVGGSFTALPPFAAAVAEGTDVRIALRGGVVARISSGTESAQEFTGAEVTTWSERFVGGATRIEITVEESDAVSALPVQSGVVRAAAVSAELEASDAERIVAVLGPAPVIESEESGVSAAVLGGVPAPALALFGAAVAPVPPLVAPVPPIVDVAPVPPVAGAAPVDAPASAAAPEPSAEDGAVEAPIDPAPEVSEPAAAEPVVDEVPVLPESVEAPVEEPSEPAAAPSDEDEAPDAASDEDPSDEDEVEGVTLIPTETLSPLSDIDEFDQLFGETVHTAPSFVDAPPPPPFPIVAEGDHDGATISAAELRALRQQPPVADDAPTQVIPVASAGFGRIRVSTGQVVELDRTVIIGRRPRSTRASGENLPHLVAVESPQQDISRSHLEVRPDADTVVVIDLHTTNGSTLLRPGADPVRLHPGEQTLVLSGDVVDLGDGVTVAFEDLP
ncbi:FHA domain-containing protein [Microbacterium sp. OVT16B]|uniref:FHA domain-containing protein n=1 Tax=Microbacterium sp. OVT16B TaxID=2862682 RepID=UPI001CC13008|nr:FHA domain-containing protein [Microbacterium sp. OVT16B]